MDKIAAPTPEQLKKQEALKQYFEKLGSVVVAFSSGVDSTYLLKVAHDVDRKSTRLNSSHSH